MPIRISTIKRFKKLGEEKERIERTIAKEIKTVGERLVNECVWVFDSSCTPNRFELGKIGETEVSIAWASDFHYEIDDWGTIKIPLAALTAKNGLDDYIKAKLTEREDDIKRSALEQKKEEEELRDYRKNLYIQLKNEFEQTEL